MHYSDVIKWRLKSPASRLFAQPFVQAHRSKKHRSSVSLAFARGFHRWPVDSHHKKPITWKMLPFDEAILVEHILARFWHIVAWTRGCVLRFLLADKITKRLCPKMTTDYYRQISNIRLTKSQNLNVFLCSSWLLSHWSQVSSRKCLSALLQLYLSDKQFYSTLRGVL